MAAPPNKDPEISAAQNMQIMARMWDYRIKDDPFKWVMYAFPWEQPKTPLARHKGPRVWQADELKRMGDFINQNHHRISQGKPPLVYQSATTSGRGPGKSAFVAMVNLWFMSCILGGTSILSANTENQLKTKTFGEIGKWKTLCLSGHWFDKSTLSITPKEWFAKELKKARGIDDTYYYANGVLWNADEPDSYAGAHNEVGIMVTFDEASGIPQPIWTVTEGFFTELSPYRFWFVFSNPRSNTGPFFECFHKHRDYWYRRQIDSRNVEGTDLARYAQIIEKYGDDSDEARIEVKGEFPKQGDRQFISRATIEEATKRNLEKLDDYAALCMGVDPARFGDDKSVIRFRRGRDARSIPPVIMSGVDNMKLANKCAELIEKYQPDAVFIDKGSGTGVIDRLREMGYKIFEVDFGSGSEDAQYADHRTEIWGQMKEWLPGAMIDSAPELVDDLAGPEYKFNKKEKKQLESKDDMKARGLASPDHGDALAVTFHCKVARSDLAASQRGQSRRVRIAKGRDYNPLG